jgi:hypothetical protein
VSGGDERAQKVGVVGRVAHFELLHALDERAHEALENGALDEEPRTAQANLALVLERGAHGAVQRLVEIAVIEHDRWVLAAKLEAARQVSERGCKCQRLT